MLKERKATQTCVMQANHQTVFLTNFVHNLAIDQDKMIEQSDTNQLIYICSDAAKIFSKLHFISQISVIFFHQLNQRLLLRRNFSNFCDEIS
jgi:hypothetical protein